MPIKIELKMRTLVFKINPIYSKKISRKIEMPENFNLYQLAKAIVKAYDFHFDHCFGFYSNFSGPNDQESKKCYELFADLINEGEDLLPTQAKPTKTAKIKDVWLKPKDKMLFLFDYGDGWQFNVELINYGDQNPGAKYPIIFDLCGLAPEQYPDYEGEDNTDEEPRDFDSMNEKQLIKILERGEFYEDEFDAISKAMEKKGLRGLIFKTGGSEGDPFKQTVDYINYHKKIPKNNKIDSSEIKKSKKILFNKNSSTEDKKRALLILGHSGKVDCLRVLEKYAQKPDHGLKIWADNAISECRLFLKSDLLDKPIIETNKI